jgi:hypothetical protein
MKLFVLVVLGLASPLVAIVCYAKANSAMHRITLFVYFLNFILGHIILLSYRLLLKPENPLLLSDSRLLNRGSDIYFILILNFTQFLVVCAGSILYGRFKHPSVKDLPSIFPKSVCDSIILLTCIGWIGNIAAIAGNQNLLSAFHPFELLGTTWLVSGFRLPQTRRWLVYSFALSHLVWAIFLFHSKSEAFLILVAIVIRVSHQGSRVNYRAIWASAVAGLLLFPFIQIQKGIFTLSRVEMLLNSQGEKHAWFKSFGIGFLQRFDGADSITDAFTAGSGAWFSTVEYTKIIVFKFFPNVSFLVGNYFGEETSRSLSLGQLWNNQMRPITIRNVTYGIPVTYGPFAEGYAVSGFLLAVLCCVLFGAALHAFSNYCYSRNLFVATCGLYFMSHLENIQNSVASTILMLPKMIECFIVLRIFMLFTSKIKFHSESLA